MWHAYTVIGETGRLSRTRYSERRRAVTSNDANQPLPDTLPMAFTVFQIQNFNPLSRLPFSCIVVKTA